MPLWLKYVNFNDFDTIFDDFETRAVLSISEVVDTLTGRKDEGIS